MWFRDDSPVIWMRIEGRASGHRTITCRFPTPLRPREITMDVSGGVARRPLRKLYDPTFWATRRFAFIQDAEGTAGMALFMGGPAAVSCGAAGALECVSLRNTRKEKAFYVLPLMGNPAVGSDPGEQSLDYAICFTGYGDWYDNGLHKLSAYVLHAHWREDRPSALMRLAQTVCTCDNDDVEVLTVKRALRGEGSIVRLYSPVPITEEVAVSVEGGGVERAFLCDARERDITELSIETGKVLVPFAASIVTVRLMVAG